MKVKATHVVITACVALFLMMLTALFHAMHPYSGYIVEMLKSGFFWAGMGVAYVMVLIGTFAILAFDR